MILELATAEDALEVAALRNAAADHLTRQHDKGVWSGHCTDQGVRLDLRRARVYILRRESGIVATVVLSTRKPWAIDLGYFTPMDRPLFLTSMVVHPALQRAGIGRACLKQIIPLARAWPADAILLDAYDHPTAGAGEFYRKCGFREVGRATYHKAPLIYFELPLPR